MVVLWCSILDLRMWSDEGQYRFLYVHTHIHGLIETMRDAVHVKDFDNLQKEVIQDILVCVGMRSGLGT